MANNCLWPRLEEGQLPNDLYLASLNDCWQTIVGEIEIYLPRVQFTHDLAKEVLTALLVGGSYQYQAKLVVKLRGSHLHLKCRGTAANHVLITMNYDTGEIDLVTGKPYQTGRPIWPVVVERTVAIGLGRPHGGWPSFSTDMDYNRSIYIPCSVVSGFEEAMAILQSIDPKMMLSGRREVEYNGERRIYRFEDSFHHILVTPEPSAVPTTVPTA